MNNNFIHNNLEQYTSIYVDDSSCIGQYPYSIFAASDPWKPIRRKRFLTYRLA